jgi:hypothetical protein
MVILTKEIGSMIKLMGMVFIKIKMDQYIKEIGKMIFKRVLVFKVGQTVVIIKEITYKEKKLEKENMSGLMEAFMMECGKIMLLMAKDNIDGRTIKDI